MKDRCQNLRRGLALGAGIGTVLFAGGCAPDVSYKDRTWGISMPTQEGDIYCYTDVLPENRLLASDKPDGSEHRWYVVDLVDFACDIPREGKLGLRTGEQVSRSIFSGSADVEEPLLKQLR